MIDLASFFQMLGDGAVAFAGAIADTASAVSEIFWTAGEGGGPTFIGLLTIAGGVGGLALFAINWIKGLFKTSTKTSK